MSEATVAPGAPSRLLVPAELAVTEIEAAVAAQASEVVVRGARRVGTPALLVSVHEGQPLAVAAVSDCDVHWATRVVLVVVYAVDSFVRVHLGGGIDEKTPQSEDCHNLHANLGLLSRERFQVDSGPREWKSNEP